ncbi:hypothetical protein DW781_07735 [Olsenella sp. AM30-3LB]|uniref:4'-phosphopantetheinyl transferase superfamily protein n=1 Tax=Olsenella sp. AM30-3LB TaxID=2292359 RepID=UPI000E53DDE1|nr:4'-phosphopantetheinyl transferase superfamily protein [Olsenella sp. AM30-3LB]RHD73333.1 hypothetical protein DW781_07735 [Olsenella sp. AM30-3LB]
MQNLMTPRLSSNLLSVLDSHGCAQCGVEVLKGARMWGQATDCLPFPVSHDCNGAPIAVDSHGNEMHDVLISLSDENDILACVWTGVNPGTPVLGLGIDLCSPQYFEGGRDHQAMQLLDRRELELARELEPSEYSMGCAKIFGAKEAAFKSLSAPLRKYSKANGESLFFEVRSFSMTELGLEAGSSRYGDAKRAMEALGVARIAVRLERVDHMAIAVAVALEE